MCVLERSHHLGGSSGSVGLNGVREKQRADQGAECSQLVCRDKVLGGRQPGS